jgi:hypothetical protein
MNHIFVDVKKKCYWGYSNIVASGHLIDYTFILL